eukprot:1318383-Pyramimonas_sp.AAC.1
MEKEEEEDQCKPKSHQRCWNEPSLRAPSSSAPTTVHLHRGACIVGRQPFEDPEACQNIGLGMSTLRVNLIAASWRS